MSKQIWPKPATASARAREEDIAIVGIGCRFPGGVKGPDDFWELLKQGRDAIVEVPAERWRMSDFYHPDREKPGKMVTRYGGFIDGIDQFDPEFFGISPHEAHHMDPQQRHLLEVTWEALEDGGLQPRQLRGRDVGVFIGAFALDYHALQFGDPYQRDAGPYTAASSMTTMISNRISYIYDFRGPSMTVDTACSSSLVSLHLACESLRKGESEVALAGGVVLIFTPQYTLVESRGGFLSPDGRCKTFDASANGYVRGEGVGVVVLKRLSDALAAGDPIQAVIMASGVNQDGHTVGITVPSSEAQEKLIRETLARSGLAASDVHYVEAHGTGTPVGDPIEARAIAAAYSERSDATPDLVVGSCKTNIGHTESAAGVAGLIKTVLALRHRQIPGNLHFQDPNPAIPFAAWKLRVPTALEPWPVDSGVAAAAVNSFGYGGTNAHVIVREATCEEAAGCAAASDVKAGITAAELTAAAVAEASGSAMAHAAADDAVHAALGAESAASGKGLARSGQPAEPAAASVRIEAALADHSASGLASSTTAGAAGMEPKLALPKNRDAAAAALIASPARSYLLPISARRAEGLSRLAAAYKQALQAAGVQSETGSDVLADLLWSAGSRREHHRQRQAFVGRDSAGLLQVMEASLQEQGSTNSASGKAAAVRPKLVWVFSGMGPQWYGMGRQLLQLEPVFAAELARCDRLFAELAGWSMLAELHKSEADSLMDETGVSMPISFALQVALAALWRSWGIVPEAIVGHSAGEVAAFYEAGVYSLDDALRVVYHRSRLLQRLSGMGGMAAVGAGEAAAAALLDGEQESVCIAAINSPASVTLAGDAEALERVLQKAAGLSYFCRKLKVQAPFHSHYMESIKDELLGSLEGIPANEPKLPLYSTVTGVQVDGASTDAAYWWGNVRQAVRFAPVIENLADSGYEVFLEIGAHPVLTGALLECFGERTALAVASIRRKEDEHEAMLRSLAELYVWGIEPDWRALYPHARWRKLPSYPWQQTTFWHEPDFIRHIRLGHRDHPLLGRPLLGAMPAWEGEVSLIRFPYLRDHRVLGQTIFPAAGYVEATMGALEAAVGAGSYALEQIELHRSLTLPQSTSVVLTQHYLDVNKGTFHIFAGGDAAGSPYTLHASGQVRQLQPGLKHANVDLAAAREQMPRRMERDQAYRILRNMGFDYGPGFQGISEVYLGEDEAWAEIRLEMSIEEAAGYNFHPRWMDACFQTLLAAEFPKEGETPVESQEEFRIPVRIGQVRYYRRPSGTLWAHSRVSKRNSRITQGDLRIYDASGRIVAEFLDFVKQTVDAGAGKIAGSQLKRWFYEPQWQAASPPQEEQRRTRRDVWLFLGDASGMAKAAASQLYDRDFEAYLAEPVFGGNYKFTAATTGTQLDPRKPAHYDMLINDALHAFGGRLRGIVHVWNLDVPSVDLMDKPENAHWEKIRTLGCHSLLYTMQSVARRHVPLRVWCVTHGAQQGAGFDSKPSSGEGVAEAQAIFQAAAWGLGRAIGQQEYRGYWGANIDLDPAADAGSSARQLVDELVSGREAAVEDQIAYRNGQRYVLRMQMASAVTAGALPMRCRPEGAYLVTGAFGALGREAARLLAERGARRLLLLGRSGLPERRDWTLLQTDCAEAERVAFVRELEAAGVDVQVVRLDVADEAALHAYIDAYTLNGNPPICGVIHSAGTLKDTLLAQMDAAGFDEAYDPKVKGAWGLHRALIDQPLEFFILYSSLAALLPPPGQGNYAAGNAFMDALAFHRRSLGLPAMSINWGPWSEGMVDRLNLTAHFQENGIDCIRPGEGRHLLEHLSGQDCAQVAVLSAEWRAVRRLYPDIALLNLLDQQEGAATADSTSGGIDWLELLQPLEEAERQRLVADRFAGIVAELLHFEANALDTSKSLPEIGLDSMMAIKLRNRLLSEFTQAPMVGDLLSGLSISGLGCRLTDQLTERLQPEREAEASLA
ncbi:type I polyketide synthase [Paenibacillus athensensis]|uniref:Uncharacterized protein n=1 Tax=Paenibacillus athensensis TaxID=1967502 RepID=A0A4Y8PX59_9BACL|nr:type I polyketide synthase [Paenibacillus athensensis]MCD1257840.1 type I polyketide synthase [Paenibacillus athensensis]